MIKCYQESYENFVTINARIHVAAGSDGMLRAADTREKEQQVASLATAHILFTLKELLLVLFALTLLLELVFLSLFESEAKCVLGANPSIAVGQMIIRSACFDVERLLYTGVHMRFVSGVFCDWIFA